MEDMDKIAADIFKAISDLKMSGIIEEIVSEAAADRQGVTSCSSESEEAGPPGDDDTSAT